MDQKELMEKVKELLKNGKVDEAKQFVADHKEELGGYFDKAKEAVKNVDLNGITDKFKNFFNK